MDMSAFYRVKDCEIILQVKTKNSGILLLCWEETDETAKYRADQLRPAANNA